MKLSETPGKETLPGATQVWRYSDNEGFYIKDVIAMDIEIPRREKNLSIAPLLKPFFGKNNPDPQIPSIHDQRKFIFEQIKH